jgi:hypothetical protein
MKLAARRYFQRGHELMRLAGFAGRRLDVYRPFLIKGPFSHLGPALNKTGAHIARQLHLLCIAGPAKDTERTQV